MTSAEFAMEIAASFPAGSREAVLFTCAAHIIRLRCERDAALALLRTLLPEKGTLLPREQTASVPRVPPAGLDAGQDLPSERSERQPDDTIG